MPGPADRPRAEGSRDATAMPRGVRVGVPPADLERALGAADEPGHDSSECRLARAVVAHHGDRAGVEVESHVAQHHAVVEAHAETRAAQGRTRARHRTTSNTAAMPRPPPTDAAATP